MAITFHTIPAAYSPSNNPLSYRWSSNQTGQPNFSYIVETWVNGAKISEEKIFPEVSSYSHKDISETVDNVLSAPAMLVNLSNDSGTSADIKIVVWENYGATPVNVLSETSATTVAFKASIPNALYTTIDFDADWRVSKWLTNHPTKNVSILREQQAIISMITDANVQMTMRFYDADDNQLHLFQESRNLVIWQVNCTKAYLLADAGISASNLSDTAYFTVQMDSSELFTFTYLDDYCYPPTSVLWINELGSFDTFIFEHADNRNGDIEKIKTYRKQFGRWDSNDFVFNANDSGDVDFSKVKRDAGTLVSEYLTEQIQNWLVEIYSSPMTLLFYVDGSTLSVRITKTKFKYEQERFEDLITEVVDYQDVNYTKSINR